jgi:hypothetical protein
MAERTPLARLVDDGLLREGAAGLEPTSRWEGAMARAALRLQACGAPLLDLRMPIATALVELYRDLADAELAALVEAILPYERRALAPLLGPDAADPR